MGAVVVAIIAVVIALGCFIAITMSDIRGHKRDRKAREQAGSSGAEGGGSKGEEPPRDGQGG
ncbi:MAG: hypothetical protein JJT85_12365 [Chromatiales bacterium]|nr:hypothetical protein [Chromatiales bacterium]